MYKTISSKELFKGKAFYFTFNNVRMIFSFKGNFTKTRKHVVASEALDFLKHLGLIESDWHLSEGVITRLLMLGHVENELTVTEEIGEFSDDKRQETTIQFSGENFFNHTKCLERYKHIGIG